MADQTRHPGGFTPRARPLTPTRPATAQAPAPSTAPAPVPAPGKGTERPAPQRTPAAVAKFYDVDISMGLDVAAVRFSIQTYHRFLAVWAVQRQDIILRLQYAQHERSILLRGDQGAVFTTAPANPARKIPQASLFTTEEIKVKILGDAGGLAGPEEETPNDPDTSSNGI